MSDLNETPKGNRIRIAFFGLRNAGKSTLVNAFTGQPIAIVSDVPGTTTDPVSKAMEILSLGPCLVTDTAGLDDEGELGRQRVEKSLKVLETTDIAVWVWNGKNPDKRSGDRFSVFEAACRSRHVVLMEFFRGDSVEKLKKKIAAVKLADEAPGLLDGLVENGDRVLCVVPIDESAPKGRLILPQQQVIRECLDRHLTASVCQPEELDDCLRLESACLKGRLLVVTDSQAFGRVSQVLAEDKRSDDSKDRTIVLTSFSILFARQKGDLGEYAEGLKALAALKDGDAVLIAEGCTHHRQCNDIGSVKIPKALEKLSGKKLKFAFASGNGFLDSCASPASDQEIASPLSEIASPFALIVQCGGCMLTRREMLRRIGLAKASGIPIVNYGMVLAAAAGLPVGRLVSQVSSPRPSFVSSSQEVKSS